MSNLTKYYETHAHLGLYTYHLRCCEQERYLHSKLPHVAGEELVRLYDDKIVDLNDRINTYTTRMAEITAQLTDDELSELAIWKLSHV